MALGATKFAVIILCIASIMLMMTGGSAGPMVGVYNQSISSINDLQNSSMTAGSGTNVVAQVSTMFFAIIPDVASGLKILFIELPKATFNVLQNSIPIPIVAISNDPTQPSVSLTLGTLIGYLVFFIMAISTISWLFGRWLGEKSYSPREILGLKPKKKVRGE